MQKYRVEMHSKAGMWAYYDGHVDVQADNEEEAIEQALDRLKRTSFPDRPRNAWAIDGVQRLDA